MNKKLIVDHIMSHSLTKKAIQKAINRNKHRGWVFDEIESLIELIDDCTEEGSLIFDELENRIDLLLDVA